MRDPYGADRSHGVPIPRKPAGPAASGTHDRPSTANALTAFVRYGIGALTVLGGIVCLIFNFGGFGIEGLFAFTGAGLSIILINVLFRMGQDSDREREDHEAAWRFYERHGHWPDEEPPSRPARNLRA
jgi:hypothetical protein